MKPYYSDDSVTLYHGDALDRLRALPDGSVDCCVTSPPYFGLRDYGEHGQYGLEASPAEYVETMRAVFAEMRRVLADDGTLWLNIGDSYNAYNGNRGASATGFSRNEPMPELPKGAGLTVKNLPAKNLLGIPWRTAFALQDDGWILRNDNIWFKTNAMPESVTDRLACKHEYVFMFSKSRTYWLDLDPIREEYAPASVERSAYAFSAGPEAGTNGKSNGPLRSAREVGKAAGTNLQATGKRHTAANPAGKNPGDVWSIPTSPFAEAHFAVMAPKVAERCILAGCKPGGTVLDPFSGAGTTGMVASKHGRRYVGIELSAKTLDLSLRTRLAQPGLDFGEATA
jgi:DNA modification methylase